MKMHARLMKLHANIGLSLWGGQSTLLFGAYSPVPVYGDDWISTGDALKQPTRALVDFEGRILDELRRQLGGGADRNDLVVLAVPKAREHGSAKLRRMTTGGAPLHPRDRHDFDDLYPCARHLQMRVIFTE